MVYIPDEYSARRDRRALRIGVIQVCALIVGLGVLALFTVPTLSALIYSLFLLLLGAWDGYAEAKSGRLNMPVKPCMPFYLHKTSVGLSDARSAYLLLGAGAGFQLTPSFVVRPAVSLAASAALINDTVFSLAMTFRAAPLTRESVEWFGRVGWCSTTTARNIPRRCCIKPGSATLSDASSVSSPLPRH